MHHKCYDSLQLINFILGTLIVSNLKVEVFFIFFIFPLLLFHLTLQIKPMNDFGMVRDELYHYLLYGFIYWPS